MFSYESHKIRNLSYICLTFLSILLLLFIVLYYVFNRNILTSETEQSLSFVTEVTAQGVNENIMRPLADMSVLSAALVEKYTPQEVIQFQMNNDTDDVFYAYYWLEPDGTAFTTSGNKIYFEMTEFMRDLFKGRSCISFTREAPETNNSAVLYGIPVKKNGQIVAALVAASEPKSFGRYALLNSFDGMGANYIVDHNGNIVTFSGNIPEGILEANLLEYIYGDKWTLKDLSPEEIYSDFLSKNNNTARYTNSNGQQMYLCYTPLFVDNWFLVSSIPFSNVTSGIYKTYAIVFAIIVVLVIAAFSIIITTFIKRSTGYRNSLEQALYTDLITGGMSYVKFQETSRDVIRNAEPGAYTFISLDIQNFKLINDINGGGGGNATLTYVHGKLKEHLPKDAIMCRADADIFNLLIKTQPIEQMAKMLSDFTEDLNKFNLLQHSKYFIRIKAGFYTIQNNSLGLLTIRDRSNIARKMAKDQQTSKLFTYDVFDEATLMSQIKEYEFENTMEQALQNNEFKMYLQPKINIQTGRVAGAEALVRWESPIYGMIQPNSFIPMFERNGFIVQIDLNVFEQACAFLRKQIDEGQTPIHLSVNLSRAHLFNPNFLDDFIEIKEKYNIPAELLEFEITESMAYEQLDTIERFIDMIHKAGFTCSIDDFGSGYSSLNMLGDIPADVLKLDKAFFKVDSHQKTRNKQILTSIITLAKELNMKVVAEGIETTSQASFLQSINCDIIQGFLYSRPLPTASFEVFLSNWTTEHVSQVQNALRQS